MIVGDFKTTINRQEEKLGWVKKNERCIRSSIELVEDTEIGYKGGLFTW